MPPNRVRRQLDRLEAETLARVERALGAMLSAARRVAADDTNPDAVRAAARSAWVEALARLLTWLRDRFSRLAVTKLGTLPDAPDSDTLQTRVDQLAAVYVRDVANRLADVPDAVFDVVRKELADGYEQGDTPQELRERVAESLGLDRWGERASRIARTETTGAYGWASETVGQIAQQHLGEPLRREWVATHDERTRVAHRAADGQTVTTGQPFVVGGELLRWPGDPLASPGNTVNCRCTTSAHVGDFGIDLSEINMDDDEPTAVAAEGVVALPTRMPPALLRYWTAGKGGAQIAWNTPGDWTRCTRLLRKYAGRKTKGLCSNLHKMMTGVWPGDRRNRGMRADEDVPCPCEDMTDEEIAEMVARVIADPETPDELRAELQAETEAGSDTGEGLAASPNDEDFDGAMIALAPSVEDAERYAVEGGVPAGELHVTLVGTNTAMGWNGDTRADILAAVETLATTLGPVEARVFGRGVFNPDSDSPAAIYNVGDNTGALAALRDVVFQLPEVPDETREEQFSPWVAHMTARYDSGDMSGMAGPGGLLLDRLRVAISGEVRDFPLRPVVEADEPAGNVEAVAETVVDALTEPLAAAVAVWGDNDTRFRDEDQAAVVAAAQNAPPNPPGEWFDEIKTDEPTPPTVTPEGRFWGLVAQRGKCFANVTDQCIQVPSTNTNYGAWYTGEVITAEGDTLPVGYLYAGCGHSDVNGTLEQARQHLAASCRKVAAVRVYDSEFGPMAVGSILPGATADDINAIARVSGEWFPGLELHAAVAVTQSAFPVDGSTAHKIRVADEAPALAASDPRTDPVQIGDLTDAVVAEMKRRSNHTRARETVLAAAKTRARREVDRYVASRKG